MIVIHTAALDTLVLIIIRREFGGMPKLPLRDRPEAVAAGVLFLASDCKDEWDCMRGTPSWVLELVEEDKMLLMLDVVLRAGVREGRGNSPPPTKDLILSWPLNDVRL